jgi:hypothetical protein
MTVLMVGLCSGVNVAQTLKPRPPSGTQQNEETPASQKESESVGVSPIMMPIIVEAGSLIREALESQVQIRAFGQAIHDSRRSSRSPRLHFEPTISTHDSDVSHVFSRI